MVDELFELVLGEKGFDVEIRCEYSFNNEKYARIKELLSYLIVEWQKEEKVPKKSYVGDSRINDMLGWRKSIFK